LDLQSARIPIYFSDWKKIEGGFLAYQVIYRSGIKNVNVIVVGVVGNTVPLFRDPHEVGIQLAIAIGIVKQDNGECPDGDGSKVHFNPAVISFPFQLFNAYPVSKGKPLEEEKRQPQLPRFCC
jgi:hypothetical protein